MKIKEVLREVFDFQLFKRNMQNALSTIGSEMQNVQANMEQYQKTSKEKEQENEKLKEQLKSVTSKLRGGGQEQTKQVPGQPSQVPGTAKTLSQQNLTTNKI